jgi:tRNA-dihydrouridine synthase A
MDRSFCIAPMMRRTDRHFRYLCGLLSKETILFTEMIHANAINRNQPERFLNNSGISNATVLQVGGSCPEELKKATLIANPYNYSEINLGCPSSKVQSGNFGAILMKNVNLVKNCLAEMIKVSSKEVSVKIRLGVDDSNINEGLDYFIEELSQIGVNTFYVHARIALLKGLDPKENRTIPPLNYERVFQIKKDFKHLNIIINGGIEDFLMAKDKFQKLDGIMVGRAAYDLPFKLFDVDRIFYNSTESYNSLLSVIDEMFEYIDTLDFKDEIKTKFHMLNLFKGLNNAKKSRLILLSKEKNDKIKSELKNILLASENKAA